MGEKKSKAGTPLTPEQQGWVLGAKPQIEELTKRLQRKFPQADPGDVAQALWEGYSHVAPDYNPDNPERKSFAAFAYKGGWGYAVDALTRQARQSPVHMARKAFGDDSAPVRIARGAYVAEHEMLGGIRAACHDSAFRMFFGATFDVWRAQGEQGLVDLVTRKKAFCALQGALATVTLTADEWKLLELYYVECQTWEEVGAAFGIVERQARRRDEQIRAKLREELFARGVTSAPPRAA